jgi:GNAT superfamily N-acetyltransferase
MLETVPINFLDYFIEQEPEHVLVAADSNDQAVGYIEAATSYKKFVKATKKIYMRRLLDYDKSQVAFEKHFLLALFFIKKWPCHMHINLTQAFQHQGLGPKLIDALIAKLKQEGYHSLAICGSQLGSSSYLFYLHCGFKEIFNYGKDIVSLGIEF